MQNNKDVLEDFKLRYISNPNVIVDWWDGQDFAEIYVVCDDGYSYIYDMLTGRAKCAKSLEKLEDHAKNEEEWRIIFARRLRRLMLKRGYNQQTFSYATGLSQGAISRYTNGDTTPNAYILQKLSKVLDCDIRHLTDF